LAARHEKKAASIAKWLGRFSLLGEVRGEFFDRVAWLPTDKFYGSDSPHDPWIATRFP